MKKIAVVVLAAALILSTVKTAKAGSTVQDVFPVTYTVSGDYKLPYFEPEVNYDYQNFFTNSKGEHWVVSFEYDKDGILQMYMLKLGLKEGKILQKVHIGYPAGSFEKARFKPSVDGRYLYFPINTFEKGTSFFDGYYLVAFDLDEGKIAWEHKFNVNVTTEDLSFSSIVPVKNGVVVGYLLDPYNNKKSYIDNITLISNKGSIVWQVSDASQVLSMSPMIYGVDNENVYTGYEYEDNAGQEWYVNKEISINIQNGKETQIQADEEEKPGKTLWEVDNLGTPDYYLVLPDSMYVMHDELPVRPNPQWGYKMDICFLSAYCNKHFIFLDSPIYFTDQNIYVYSKDGLLWHKDFKPINYRPIISMVLGKNDFFYSYANTMYALNLDTGKQDYKAVFGNYARSMVLGKEDSGNTVWIWAKEKVGDSKYVHIVKLTLQESTLTVNSNTDVGDCEIAEDGQKVTVHYGVPVVLPPGTYTITPLPSSVINGIEVPKPVTVTLENGDSKTVKVQYKDAAPPIVTVNEIPEPKVIGGTAFFTITGLADDNFSGIKNITVNGMNASYYKDKKSWSATVMVMSKGIVEFDVVAVDNAGNKAEKKVHAVYYPPVKMKLQIDSSTMVVNKEKEALDSPPVIIPKWNRTVVPIRAVVEALGGTATWDGTERKVTVEFNGTTIEMWIGKPQAEVNGVMEWIDPNNHDVKPIIINSRTMLPLRFVVEHLGCTVDWDAATKTITITYTP